MKTLIWLIIPLSFLSGCIGIPRLTRPERPVPHYVQHWEERERVTPVVVSVDNDRVVVVEERERILIAGTERTEPPKGTFAQRIGDRLGGLGTIAVIVLIACLILIPGVTMGWLLRTGLRFRRAFRETVAGIKEARAISDGNELYNCLKSKQSVMTKKMVGNLKADL